MDISNIENVSGIYKLTFPNGKSYIRQSYNLHRRMLDYKHWQTRCKNQTALYNAFNKYGVDQVIVEILCSGKDLTQEERNSLEIKYIVEYNTQTPNGYNIEPEVIVILIKKIPVECIEDLKQPIEDQGYIYSGITE